jgi:hypothetical protein
MSTWRGYQRSNERIELMQQELLLGFVFGERFGEKLVAKTSRRKT